MDYARLREQMVEHQIRARGVLSESVLSAMKKIPREHFVPKDKAIYAYEDQPLEIGYRQTISQPYIVALMTELAAVGKNDRVLEIGTGSGYQTAFLCGLAGEVYAVERIKKLSTRADTALKKAGYENAFLVHGDGYQGYPDKAPYNSVIVTAAPEQVPPQLLSQLADGGRLVIPVGSYVQYLVVYERTGSKFIRNIVTGVRFVSLLHSTEDLSAAPCLSLFRKRFTLPASSTCVEQILSFFFVYEKVFYKL